MPNTRYGLKEVANVIFFDISTNKPAIFFDTLKVSTIENESESAEARGGQGNNKLMSWDFGRTATLDMQDALLSDVSLAMLAGKSVKTTGIKAVGRETLTLVSDTDPATKVTLKETPIENTVAVYKVQGGIMTDEITGFTVTDKDVKFADGQTVGQQVMVFYEYEVTSPNASQVTFSGNAFPATYKVVGDTVVRDENGIDRKMQFIIPKAKLQSTFSLTMDVENVSTFDFKLDVLVETGTQRLYDIIRL
ncbi:hypothetical protein FKN04_12380 [Bacillus glycinifermentans]|uniref:hypothetical protein n=1 Tax=Bacillus TaxID=1386 RepID=UPI001581D8F0|nr:MULTISPECIES: hypothetical protein [Bacillus]NUJ17377.1 hypothetical protein [Bacillus glycinifermentans]GIN66337.1 hypothetical protein J41TS2_17580 [Bacillus sonorensis]